VSDSEGPVIEGSLFINGDKAHLLVKQSRYGEPILLPPRMGGGTGRVLRPKQMLSRDGQWVHVPERTLIPEECNLGTSRFVVIDGEMCPLRYIVELVRAARVISAL